MGRPRKVEEIDLTSEEKKLPVKSSISSMSGKYIANYSEDSYELSLREAFRDVEQRNSADKNKIIVLRDVYYQKHMKKSILVSYDLEERSVPQNVSN